MLDRSQFTVFLSKRLVGSYVGNRQDATEALDIASSGKVKTIYKVSSASSQASNSDISP